jgi:glycine/serine hydroxymethyltransferase
MREDEIRRIAVLIDRVLADAESEATIDAVRADVRELAGAFPLYGSAAAPAHG